MTDPILNNNTVDEEYSQETWLTALLKTYRCLDQLLIKAIEQANKLYASAADPYRGLHIDEAEVSRLLSNEPGTPLLWLGDSICNSAIYPDNPLNKLVLEYELSAFEVDIILITLAPEFDLRYERLFAFLQDDVTRKRPTVDLVLNLLCPTTLDKLHRRIHFAAQAPLVVNGIISLIPDSHQLQPGLLGHYLKLDDQFVRFLLGPEGLDARLISCCKKLKSVTKLNELTIKDEIKYGLNFWVQQYKRSEISLLLYFPGAEGFGKLLAAEAIASECGEGLLVADLAKVLLSNLDFDHLLNLLLNESRLSHSVLFIENVEILNKEEHVQKNQSLLTALSCSRGIIVLASIQPWTSSADLDLNLISIPFDMPDIRQRQTVWERNLAEFGVNIPNEVLKTLAERFLLTTKQISHAVLSLRTQRYWQQAVQNVNAGVGQNQDKQNEEIAKALFVAARAQSGQDLARLALKQKTNYAWSDLILPEDQYQQLKELCIQASNRHIVYKDWGFDRKLSFGKGLNALFVGPPGTGKTMAAEVIANALSLDLYKIDLSQVVSKYIGETEKNLASIFFAAENANAILFFDEADALFGKRSEVKDAHDRYANIEVGYLLQKMEEYQGIAILATNLRSHLDDAFSRRLHAIVEFPFPDEAQRLQIWENLFPPEAPLADDVDFGLLAREIRLAGGNIKNIGLTAAFYAAGDHAVIHMRHILHASRREYQKLGRTWNEINHKLL